MGDSPVAGRAALIEAARAELADHGRSGLGLRAVARRAGVSHAAPAYHFTDRAGLLTAVAASGFRDLAERLDAPIGESASALATLGSRYVRFALENPALYELMFHARELKGEDAELIGAQTAALRALTESTGADGIPGELTLISWAFAHGLASLASLDVLQLPTGGRSTVEVDALVRAFAARIEARPNPNQR